MSTEVKAEKIADLQQQQLAALDLATKQQLNALAQQREVAMESAKYWDNVAKQAAAGLSEEQAAALRASHVSSTVLTEAHFTYLESATKAQVDFIRTLLTAGSRYAGSELTEAAAARPPRTKSADEGKSADKKKSARTSKKKKKS